MDMTSLRTLMTNLLSGNNEVRKEAEASLEEAKKNPAVLVPGLCELIKGTTGGEQVMAAILLKKTIMDDLYSDLPPQYQESLRAHLLQFLNAELAKPVRAALEKAVSTLGSRLLESNGWPELMPGLYQVCQTASGHVMISALNILSSMAASLDVVGGQVCQCLAAPLANQDPAISLAAIKACGAFITQLDDPKPFAVHISTVLSKLSSWIGSNTSSADEVIEVLSEVMESNSDFIIESGTLQPLLQAMFSTAEDKRLEEDDHQVQQRAVELMLVFVEADPRQAKKTSGFLERLVNLMLCWMQTVSDEDMADWSTTKDDEEDEEDYTNAEMGASGLDRIALAVGGKEMEKHLGGKLMALVNEQNKQRWQNRHAAVTALSNVAEGCKKRFEPNLGTFTHLILSHFTDPHPMVRHAAVRAIAQFCTDFSPEFQALFYEVVLDGLTALLNDQVPRVRHVAASAMINFCDEAQPDLYAGKVEGLLKQLFNMLNNQQEHLFVKEVAMAAVSAVAENLGKRFLQYYDTFMPITRLVLFDLPEDKSFNTMKGKAIECASFVANACGPEKFLAGGEQSDAKKILDYMMNLTLHMPSDDTRGEYIAHAWTRFAVVCGDHFQPYLPTLLDKLLKSLQDKQDMELLDGDEEVSDKNIECITLGIKGEGQRKLALHTSVLDEKQQALDVLVNFFECLGKLMFPHIERVLTAAFVMMEHPYSSEGRNTAASLCPLAMKSVKQQVEAGACPPEELKKLMNAVRPELVNAIKRESEVETAGFIVKYLTQTITHCGKECIARPELENMLQVTKEIFEESLKRAGDLASEQKKHEEYDEDEQEKIQEQHDDEEELMIQCSELVGKLMATHECFVEHFVKDFLPLVTSMFDVSKFRNIGVKLALCICDDFLEFGKVHAMPYYHNIVSAQWQFATLDPDVSQAACYGLNVAAVYGKNITSVPGNPGLPPNFIAKTLAVLKGVLGMGKKGEEWQAPVCNAVSALLTILREYVGQPGVSEAEILPMVCQLLPVGGDVLEARVVHEKIFQYVQQGNEYCLGPNKCNLEAVKKVAKTLIEEEDEDEIRVNPATAQLIRQLFSG